MTSGRSKRRVFLSLVYITKSISKEVLNQDIYLSIHLIMTEARSKRRV